LKSDPKIHRELTGFWKWLTVTISTCMVLFYFTGAILIPFPLQHERGLYVLFTFVLIFLYYPLKGRAEDSPNPTAIDILLSSATIIVCVYWIVQYTSFSERLGFENEMDYLIGVVGIAVCLEAARRILGWSLAFICIAVLLYARFGEQMPEFMRHEGFTYKEIVIESFVSTNGIYGILTHVLSKYVVHFIFFGAFLHKSGAVRFLFDLPMALVARSRGGPAKVAVMASALFGSISGSAAINTLSSGPYTIPLMKKAGFKPHVAGAIEPSASIGGMFLPPVMGAGGFIMAEMLERPYIEIMGISILPALIYFLAVFLMVHFEAAKFEIRGFDEQEVPKVFEILKKGWTKIIPLVVLTVLMLKGWSPGSAAFWATLSCIVVSWGSRQTRMGFKEITEAMIIGSRQTLIVGATVGVVGIIVGVIQLTGMSLLLSDLIGYLPQFIEGTPIPRVLVVLLITALISLILGLGIPVTAAYLITVVLLAPSLAEAGIALVATHMIIYWFSQDSNITPPLSIAVFAGAAIAGADPWKTGRASLKFSIMLYLMPVFFAFIPAILLNDTIDQIIIAYLSCALGTLAFVAFIQAYFILRTSVIEWLVLIPIIILLFWPTIPTTLIGLVMLVFLALKQRRSTKTPHLRSNIR
jgi:TRAP transporter 4TM/12TM fusion protein